VRLRKNAFNRDLGGNYLKKNLIRSTSTADRINEVSGAWEESGEMDPKKKGDAQRF